MLGSGPPPLRTLRSFRITDLPDSLPEDAPEDASKAGGSGGGGAAGSAQQGKPEKEVEGQHHGGKKHQSQQQRRHRRRRLLQAFGVGVAVLLAGLWLKLDSLSEEPKFKELAVNMAEWLPAMGNLSISVTLPELPILDAWQDQLRDQINSTLAGIRAQLLSGSPEGAGAQGAGPGAAAAAAKGWKAKHPVVIVPGFVTSGLELWQGHECAKRYFRQRMWGTLGMMQAYLRDADCWFKHMSLDPRTGLDPEGIRIRAANGLEAIDYFVQGYWVWSKLVEALGEIGYDSNNLVAMSYDWRLAIPMLEVRDGYFTRLKSTVETLHELTGEKAVLVSHSFGENVARAFYTWADQQWPGWVERELEATVNIAGPTLGIPKAVTALLSGEMRDTAQLGALASYLTNNLIPTESRAKLFRTWGSLLAMLPVGGTKVWGNTSWAPDDSEEVRRENRSFGAFVAVQQAGENGSSSNGNGGGGSKGGDNGGAGSTAGKGPEANGYCRADDGRDVGGDACDADLGSGSANGSLGGGGSVDGGGGDAGTAGGEGRGGWLGGWLGAAAEAESNGSSVPPSTLELSGRPLLTVEEAVRVALSEAGAHLPQRIAEWGAVPDLSQPAQQGGKQAAGTRGGRSGSGAAAGKDGPSVGGAAAARAPVEFPDATKVPLPRAPSFQMYCLYGFGLKTERSYHYLVKSPPVPPAAKQPAPQPASGSDPASASGTPSNASSALGQAASRSAGAAGDEAASSAARGGMPAEGQAADAAAAALAAAEGKPVDAATAAADAEDASAPGSHNWRINTAVTLAAADVGNGVQMSDGDLTVPLLSLGAMCHKGWRTRRLNPSGLRVVLREKAHLAVPLDLRGGVTSGQHIDLLGNEALLMDVLAVVSGHGSELQDDVRSDIARITDNIDFEAV